MSTTYLPFRRLKPAQWLNLLWIALAIFYVLYTVGSLWYRGLFDFAGTDFRPFRASAEIAYERGFAQVYDLAIQERFQRPLYDAYARGASPWPYETVPMPYMPAFVLAFLPMLLLPPAPGFVVWTLLNGTLLVLYLRRLSRALGIPRPRSDLIGMMVCVPAFLTLFFGQVSVWLLVFLGEFLLCWWRGREFQGGLWLAGLLLKPQFLILLLPGLLIARRFKLLAGFAAAGLALLALSFLLAGWQGLMNLAQLILLYPGELPTTSPNIMMNWRSLAVNLDLLLPSPLAWGPAVAGMGLTGVAGFSLWLRSPDSARPRLALAVLGTYAATCAITWHAHVHMALPLLAPLLLLQADGALPRGLLNLWIAVPGVLFVAVGIALPGLGQAMAGLSLLALNLYLLAWSVREFWRPRPDPGQVIVGPAWPQEAERTTVKEMV